MTSPAFCAQRVPASSPEGAKVAAAEVWQVTLGERLELAEEAADAAGLLLADAVAVTGRSADVDLLRIEYLRTRAEVDNAWAELEGQARLGIAS